MECETRAWERLGHGAEEHVSQRLKPLWFFDLDAMAEAMTHKDSRVFTKTDSATRRLLEMRSLIPRRKKLCDNSKGWHFSG